MRKLLFSLLLLWPLAMAYSQAEPDDFMAAQDKLLHPPQSPEAAAFEKYGAAPVNIYSGTASVAIPLYTLQGNEYQLPISLTYDTSGIKVEQVASNVGLGWNLNYGGVVTRKVNGLPDDIVGGYTNITPVWNAMYKNFQNEIYNGVNFITSTYSSTTMANWVKGTFYTDYQLSLIDTQADTFSFNVNGLSGTIIIEYEDDGSGNTVIKAYCLENPDIKVEAPGVKGNYDTSPITSWIITDTNGTTYYFEQAEVTNNQVYQPLGFTNSNFGVNYDIMREYNSAWYVTKIVSPNGVDVFEFNYSSPVEWSDVIDLNSKRKIVFHTTQTCGSQVLIQRGSNPQKNEYTVEQFHLTSITYRDLSNTGTAVTLLDVTTDSRSDLSANKRIKELTFYDLNGIVTKRVALDNADYFRASSSQSPGQDNNTNSRLKLDGVSIYRDNISDAKKYLFEYESEDGLPERTCNAQDFWGYYNGGNCSGDLVAKVPQTQVPSWPVSYGRDRTPDLADAKVGSLTSITYPTGGKTVFEYEAHQGVNDYLNAIGDVVGGLRIKKTTDYENDTDIATVKYFYYNDLEAKINDNTFNLNSLTPSSFSVHPETSGVVHQPLFFWEKKIVNNGDCGGYPKDQFYQYPRNLATQAPNVVAYTLVSEVVFRATGLGGFDFEGCTITEFYNNPVVVTPRLNSPFVNFEVLNGEVKKTRVFDATMELLSETENVYSNVDVSTNGPNQNLYQGVHLYQTESSPTTTHNNVCLLNNGASVGIANMQTTGLMFEGVMQQTNNCAHVNGGPVALTTFVDYQINPYKFHPKWKRLDSTITKTYENGDELVNTVTYSYNQFPTHYQLTEIESTDSKGKLSKTEIIYAGDAIGTGAYTGSEETPLIELRDRNQISEVVMAKRYYDNALIGVQQKKYKNNIGNTQEGKKLIRTNQILAAKGTNALEVRRVIQSFDDYGNPVEVFTPLGAKTYFVWGYYGKLLIAKVDNRVETIPQNDVDAAITASNNDTDTNGFLEGALKSKLQILRDHFSSSLVSTYTYDPGVGVTSMTDALGYTMTYVYDQHNRLLEVRDADGNLVSENEYNLREN